MLRLYYSNRLEDLLAPLAESVHAQQVRDPLAPVTIVVPGRVMAQYVKFELAERLGVAANLRFPFLQEYLAGLVRKVEPGLDILDRPRLELLLYERLGRREVIDTPGMAPVRAYLGVASSPPDRNLRQLEIAREVSGLFLEYAFSRQELIAAWRQGPQLAGTPYAEAERWQRTLWRSVLDDRGALLSGPVGNPPVRWQLLPDAIESLPAGKFDGEPPAHLFGLFYLAPAFPRLFGKLAKEIAVHCYTTVPCSELREDAAAPEGNRAVSSWARPGREFLRLLSDACDPELHACFASAKGREPGLLSRIQGDILRRLPAESVSSGDDPDASIRFLACPGIRREAEIVAGRIWSYVAASPRRGPERLRFHEIAVLVPESLEETYVPHLEAAFRELHDIPVNVLSRPLQTRSRLVEAVQDLLDLPRRRFGKQEMVRLLTHPCVAGSARDGDRDRWREWCEQLHVVYGADRSELSDTFVYPRDLYNWDQGLRRLALGVFMAGAPSGVDGIFEEGERECMPLEVPQSEAQEAQHFVSLARSLIADARSCRDAELRPQQWAELFAWLVRTYIHPVDDDDEAVRQACLNGISRIGVDLEPEPVPFEVAHALVTAALSDIQLHSGKLTRRGVAVGTLRSMRTVPFKVIFAVGLGESIFPAQERGDTLDLRQAERRAGDASVAERDRYLFLETLLAARAHLVLSYVARDARTGETLEPSTIVRELQYLLRGYVEPKAIEAMTEEFPVTRYVAHDLEARIPGPADVDPAATSGGRFRALGDDLRRHLGGMVPPDDEMVLQGLADMPDPRIRNGILPGLKFPDLPGGAATKEGRCIHIPLAALRKFLECPLQGAARYALRIFEDELESGEEAEEPLKASALERTILARDAFREALRDPGKASEAFENAYRRAVLLGKAPAGPFGEAERSELVSALAYWTENARIFGLHDLTEWGVVQIGGAHEWTVAKEQCAPIVIEDLTIRPSGGGTEQVTVRLFGATELVSPGADAAVRCVLRPGKKVKPGDYLHLYFTAIALAAANRAVADPFRAVVLPGGECKGITEQRIQPLSANEAREYIAALLADLLSGSHAYFLPFDAVWKARAALADPSMAIVPLIEDVRQAEYARCSSDYGPVRDARRFLPPSEKEARAIIDRRFGPLFRCLDLTPSKLRRKA